MNDNPKTLKIGVAPMEGVSDFPYRLWVHLISRPDFISTPFFRVTEGCNQNNIPRHWLPEALDDRIHLPYKVVPQLMGSSTDILNDLSERLVKHVPFVDINFGCPAKRVVGKGSGSSLLRDLDYFFKFLDRLQSSGNPYSIKIRTGYEDSSQFEAMIDGIAKYSFEQLTVHGRTKEQSYRGQSDWGLIHDACRVPFSVIGSGDIQTFEGLQSKLKQAPNVDGVIVGRAVSRNPWIFQELRQGSKVEIDPSLVVSAMTLYAVIHHLFLEDYERLVALINKGFFNRFLSNDKAAWDTCIEELIVFVYGRKVSPRDLVMSNKGLGRVKLLWHNLRTSLPEAFFEPTILRAKSFADLLINIDAKVQEFVGVSPGEKIIIQPNSKYDWLFSGESKPKP